MSNIEIADSPDSSHMTLETTAPREGWERSFWIALIAMATSVVVAMGTLYYSFSLFSVPWIQTFAVSRAEVSLIPVAMVVGGIASGPPIGWMLDRYSGRKIVAAGHLMLAVGMLLVAVANSWWQILLINVCMFGPAIHMSGLMAAQTLIGRWAPSRIGAAVTIVGLGSSLGGFLVPPVIAPLLTAFGWRHTYLMIAGFIALILVPLVLAALGPASRHNTRPHHAEHDKGLGWIGDILRERSFWVLSVSMLALTIGLVGVQHSLAPFAGERGISLAQASLLISLLSVAMVASKVFWIAIIDRASEVTYFAIMALALIAGLLIIRFGENMTQICIGLFVLGLGGGGTGPFIPMSASRHFGVERLGRALSLVYIPISMSAIGAPIAGAAYDHFGSYVFAFDLFIILAVVSLLTIVALGFASRHGKVR